MAVGLGRASAAKRTTEVLRTDLMARGLWAAGQLDTRPKLRIVNRHFAVHKPFSSRRSRTRIQQARGNRLRPHQSQVGCPRHTCSHLRLWRAAVSRVATKVVPARLRGGRSLLRATSSAPPQTNTPRMRTLPHRFPGPWDCWIRSRSTHRERGRRCRGPGRSGRRASLAGRR